MPRLTKQSTTNSRTRKRKGKISSRIRSVGEHTKGIKMNVYGRGKTGKTRFACSFPKPLLVLGTEDGTQSVSNVKGVEFLPIEHSNDIELVLEVIDNYKSVVVDTAGGLQDLILKEVLGVEEVPIQKTWGIASRQDWMTCGMQVKERLRLLFDKADSDKLNVVVIAHERNFNVDDGDSNLIFPTVGSALMPSVTGWLNGECDYICQTHIREKTVAKKVKVGDKEHTVQQFTGKAEYCLRVGPDPVYITGFRLPVGTELPDYIVNPTYEKVRKIMKGV